MSSTFHGLETARRGMNTQQAALHTTGHNISNANTEGYTRQRVNFAQTEPYPNAARNAPRTPGQIGTGVEADFIQRVRENYLDIQYRGENAQASYWETRYDSLERIEDLMNEPSKEGIATTMDEFWNALQDLSVNPEDSGARSVVRQRGMALAETFNYVSDSLQSNKKDVGEELKTTASQINSILSQINDVNKEIGRVEPHKQMPNDMYDERGRLLDEISSLVNIDVQRNETKGHALDAAEGTVNVFMTDEEGNRLTTLVDGENKDFKELSLEDEEDGQHTYISSASFDWYADNGEELVEEDDSPDVSFLQSPGKLKALVESFGYQTEEDDTTKGTYPGLIDDLDNMVKTFTDKFNEVHESGWNLRDINSGEKGSSIPFFAFDGTEEQKGYASALQVHEDIEEDLDNIAASSPTELTLTVKEGSQDQAGPTLSGKYEEDGPKELQVRYTDEDGWQYSLVGTDEAEQWEDIEEGSETVDGLTINVEGLDDPEDGTVWSYDEPIINGTGPQAFAGDGSNALNLANVKDANLDFDGESTTNVQSYYQGVIGEMAVDTDEAQQKMHNTDNLRENVNNRRQEVSSVSLDEEMTNMIQFQHAYNASARNITMIDEMLDRIINNMGVVGR
ncbi:flagellar hook-associated protein FlgK [Alteribacillus bidgolensis]|uniref:Flagellar hook-associated protein 1 n=1 Tax=Alteribacillus bidgolensis TaxID=930129 RepID=A0A1G8E333_9BACI|nr:flagellar hook-associated protein FlgK [Alteribacillus bidgolensis]SDH64140.1 flagellar hook-associated protein 1 FlgK [Alteribacillus bidgolensis]